MTDPRLLSALLLVLGGTTVLLRSQARRPDLRARLRRLDGVPRPSRRTWWRAGLSVVLVAVIPAVPLLLVGTGQVALGLALALLLAPFAVTIGVELSVGLRRSGLPVRIPLAAQWQRRWAARHVTRILAPFPAPTLRRRPPRVHRRPPALTSAGGGRRLLVVPPGSPVMRAWELAEVYLGSRRRYRDVLGLNARRCSPDGALITEDSRIGPGWVLVMPRDAIGVGLVDLPHVDPSTATTQPDRGGAAGPADEGAAAVDHPPAALPRDLVHAPVRADAPVTALAARRPPVPPPDLPRRVDPEPEIVVRLFGGSPQLHGPGGRLDADPLSIEIVTFLALRGTTTREELAAAVFPAGVPAAGLETALEVVAGVLLSVPSGEPGVLEHHDGTLALTDDVQLDWHLFVALCVGGRVARALELLGRVASSGPGARDRGHPYGWLTGFPLSRTLPGYLADVVHGVVAHRLGEGRPDLAITAARAGLRVLPSSRTLREDLESAARALGPERLGAGSGPAS